MYELKKKEVHFKKKLLRFDRSNRELLAHFLFKYMYDAIKFDVLW